MESKNLKGINHGNSSYSLIPYDNAGNIDVPSLVNRLLPLDYVADATDFFTTDTVNHTITMSKAGYLRVALKTTLIVPTGGELNLQVFKNGIASINARRQFNAGGSVDVGFEELVEIGDVFYIELRANMDGVALKYIAPLNNFVEQPTYVMNLELAEPTPVYLQGVPDVFFTNPIYTFNFLVGVYSETVPLETIANRASYIQSDVTENGTLSRRFVMDVSGSSYADKEYVYLDVGFYFDIGVNVGGDQAFYFDAGSETWLFYQSGVDSGIQMRIKGWYQVDKSRNRLYKV